MELRLEIQVSDCEAIEAMIDQFGIKQVLEAIDQITCDKANHIRENWQDESLARSWDNVGRRLMPAIQESDGL